MSRWRKSARSDDPVLGRSRSGTSLVSSDRPGVVRGKGRPLTSIDKAAEKRSIRIPEYKEKIDKLRAVILNFAETKNVIISFL